MLTHQRNIKRFILKQLTGCKHDPKHSENHHNFCHIFGNHCEKRDYEWSKAAVCSAKIKSDEKMAANFGLFDVVDAEVYSELVGFTCILY